MTEPETIEGEVSEVVGQALERAEVTPPPSTLFRTDDPQEVMRRAAAVAETLKDALRKQNLISVISGREHVKVEGWTLCGTLLGVFPVLEWTRRVEHPAEGWEARVEARTLSGAVVGAAEAQCLRSENMWGFEPKGKGGRRLEARDDFALRSMAQTRATSKALRQPLGFIVTLAGFDATPAEEMSQEPEKRDEGGAGPAPVPRSWAKVRELVEKTCDNREEAWKMFEAFVRAASYHLYGQTDSKDLSADQRKVMLQKASGAAVWLAENVEPAVGDLVVVTVDDVRAAWASVLDGMALEVPDYVAPKPPEPDPDDVPFGDA